jgi:transcriptional regulator with GAF, ATPase, and Fis domain
MNRRKLIFSGTAALGLLAGSAARAAEPRRDGGDILAGLGKFADGLAPANQPENGLAALDKALAATVGHKLFTVLVVDWKRSEYRRAYTNQPQGYPVGGSKPMVKKGAFYDNVVVDGKWQIHRNYEEVKAAFPDHELIRSLGCESAVNVPVRFNGRTVGSLNLLHEARWYTDADLASLSLFAAMAASLLLSMSAADQAGVHPSESTP